MLSGKVPNYLLNGGRISIFGNTYWLLALKATVGVTNLSRLMKLPLNLIYVKTSSVINILQ